MNRLELLEKMIRNVHTMTRYMAPHKERLYVNCPYTRPQMTLLATIFDSVSITSKDLARKMNITAGAVTQLIAPLEEQGIITKTKMTNDLRIMHIRLTPKGIDSYHKERTQYIENMLPLFDTLSDAELETLVILHEKVVHNLSKTNHGENATNEQ